MLIIGLMKLLVCYICLGLYGSVLTIFLYLRICSFLRGDSAEIFARTKWVISSSIIFYDQVEIAPIIFSFFYDKEGDKYDMFG